MQMNTVYDYAIHGRYPQPTGKGPLDVTVCNMLPIPLAVYEGIGLERFGFDPDSGTSDLQCPPRILPPHDPGKPDRVTLWPDKESYLLFISAVGQSFVAAAQVTGETTEVSVNSWYLLEPNDIGTVPTPDATEGTVVPADSPPVVVGCGRVADPTGSPGSPNVVIREQFWQALPDSYSVAPGEKKQYSLEVTSGMQRTTSEEDTVAASVSASVGGGWGPVSASVSAALSASSTTSQQVVISEETTKYVSDTHGLPDDHVYPKMVMHWQLTDRVTLYDSATIASDPERAPLSSVVVSTQPTLASSSDIVP
ncbi:hypothetical protein [Streptomyces sp. B6B3]|uniref:hypothetical protein n=1 Tax=Streptomyces sp. B6B3 TaxID=3153570 RepID=UPI00325E17C6